jgi:NAD(P)H-binding
MLKPRIIVTGATGKTGSVVVTELLKASYPVRALVHREDGRSTLLKAQRAEIAVADLMDAERVADPLKDVQRAYYCPPYDPYMIQGAVAFAVAAKDTQLEHLVGLTQWTASPSHPGITGWHLKNGEQVTFPRQGSIQKTNFCVFRSPRGGRAQESGCSNTAKSFYTARVIRDRCAGSYLPVDVRFAPKSTEVLRCRESTLWANRGHHSYPGSTPVRRPCRTPQT